MMCGNLAQVITAFEFANDPLDASAAIVEPPQVERLQRQIGDEHLVKKLADFEERQLLAWFFCLWSSDHYVTVAFFQAEGAVEKLSGRYIAPIMTVTQSCQSLLENRMQLDRNHKARFLSSSQAMVL